MASLKQKRGSLDVSALPEPLEITGPWELRFPPHHGAPDHVTLPELTSWSDHPDAGVKFFSGTATYLKTFNFRPNLLTKDSRIFLDLGKVAVIAHVKLNQADLGTLWKPPFRIEVTEAIKAGENNLEIQVVNLWANRMIGDEQLPEDSERETKGTLKRWPEWLLDGKPSPAGRYTFTSWRLWNKDSPLQQSGLMGPATICAVKEITLAKP